MSSMHRKSTVKPLATKPLAALALLAGSAILVSTPVLSESLEPWDKARAELVAGQPGKAAQAIDRWQFLTSNELQSFDDYAGFMLANPGFPRENQLQRAAEQRLDSEAVSYEKLVAFFDQYPPLSNGARGRYALALASMGRGEATAIARAAWRGGPMAEITEAYLQGRFAAEFTQEDHDLRMDALLWHGQAEAALRQQKLTSAGKRSLFDKRLALLRDVPQDQLPAIARDELHDPGLVYNLIRYYRKNRLLPQAIATLADRPKFSSIPHDAQDMIGEMLIIARGAGARPAWKIAASVDDLFVPGTDISTQAYKLRDDYTSLMWLGGTKALWELNDGGAAAPLFYRYGAAARTPQTRSKGFFWAGLASSKAGNTAEAQRYWDLAAQYPDRFYGMLALDQLGRTMPQLGQSAQAQISDDKRAKFNQAPLTRAVREVARGASWRTGIQFYRAISQQAESLEDHLLVADLATQTGRRDLAVNLADAAQAAGHDGFTAIGYPTMDVPPGADWTMVHAITRQESQFAQNAISHAGARGLMQLMPGTAREQAGKLGMNYLSANLIDSPGYNIQLGNGYFARMMDYYGGAYPLAIAAYNAGPGNVNKWLRRNGDPRDGDIEWIEWIERIPIYETKNYVQRVIENAAVYEQLYPAKAAGGKPRTARNFLN